MRDIERLLAEAMQTEGERVDPDTYSARREFLERRRKKRIRFAFSGVAVACAAVAAAVFVASSVPSPVTDDELELASAIPVVVATAPVEGAPEAAAVVEDGVWIANAEPGRISKIEPATNEVITSVALDGSVGTPDEIVPVGSFVAVTTTDGYIHVLDAGSGEVPDSEPQGGLGPIPMDMEEPTAAARRSDTFRLDLDVVGDTVWVANENDGYIYALHGAGSGGKDFTGEPVEDIAPNDVAVGDGRVFGLDGDRGKVAVFEITGEPGPPKLERTGTFDSPSGNYLDMRYGFGKLWISDESGNVYAFDPDSGEELSVTQVGGRYSDLVVDSESVWALPGGDGAGRLVAIDPDDGALRNEGTPIDGNPVDVVSGLGSLWVVDKAGATDGAAGSLLRVDPTGVGTPSPEPEKTPAENGEEASSAEPFFVYSAAGDVFLEMTDGSSKQISMGPDEELNPTFGFGSLIFERHDYENDRFGLIEHDLETGEEQLLGIDGGSHPVMSAGGDLAWVNGSGSIELWPGFSRSEGKVAKRIEIPLPEGLGDARSLIFSDDAQYLYYQALGEGWVTVQVSLEGDGSTPSSFVLNGVNDQPPGSTFIAPEDPSTDGVTVLDVCCREVEGDPYSQFRIARLAFPEGAATYEAITGPADLADADPGSLTMVSLHGAVQQGDGAWELFADEKGSWLVSDGSSLWLLHTGSGGQMTPDTLAGAEALSGLSVNPFLEGHN